MFIDRWLDRRYAGKNNFTLFKYQVIENATSAIQGTVQKG
jgi:hypothetical protein